MSTIIWRFTDGRPGHDVQSLGLAQALRTQTDVSVFDLPLKDCPGGFWLWASGRYPRGASLPAPDLLLGAGHGTHWHLLAARRRWGGRIILFMKPSLPLSWFDLCLVPEHDTPPRLANVLVTTGVLNTVQPGVRQNAETGLVLLGGPSRHFRWDDDELLGQLEQLLAARPPSRWLLASSPRTPAPLLRRLAGWPGFECLPFASTDRKELAACMARAGEIWVSEDSVSMLHEALSSGARVGLLRVRRGAANRVTAAVDALLERDWLGEPGRWQPGAGPGRPLNEAGRCAAWVRDRWLSGH